MEKRKLSRIELFYPAKVGENTSGEIASVERYSPILSTHPESISMDPVQFLYALSPAVDSPLTVQEALSGILGTISLVSWIVLFVPQTLENYQNQSGNSISMTFLLMWLFGDIANLAGSIEANLLSTVITLAVYFCLADFVIIGQTLYYRYINERKSTVKETRRQSRASHVDGPTQPLLPHRRSSANSYAKSYNSAHNEVDRNLPVYTKMQGNFVMVVAKNILSLIAVVLIGCLGWFLAWKSGAWSVTVEDGNRHEPPSVGIYLGYMSAILYLGARVPQILKNYKNKSCDGLSILFFLLSLLGNVTYGAGILFHSTDVKYILHNLPWLIGSLGTMAQDFIIFGQFHYYTRQKERFAENSSAIV